MAKISQYSEAVSTAQGDFVAVVQDGLTKKLDVDKISGLQALGVNQAWQDVTGSRTAGVTYTNTTGKTIMWSLDITDGDNNGDVTIVINGVTVFYDLNIGSRTMAYVIPDGHTYGITLFTSATLSKWSELR